MSDRTYIFRLRGDGGDLNTAVDASGRKIDQLLGKTQQFGTAAGVAGQKAAEGFKANGEAAQKAGEHVEGFSFKTAGAKRELLVLAHELSQGQYSRFGGSLLVLGERTGAASLLFSGLGIAALAATAVIAGFASQVVKGYLEQQQYNKDLLATGNYAGQTSASITALSRAIATTSSGNVLQAREVVLALAATGEVGPRLIGPLADAMVRVQKATGQTTEEITKDFAKIGDSPAKFAAEHNKAFNFITGDQYAFIKRLEEQGEKEQAALEVAKLLSAHFSGPLANSIYHVGDLSKGVADDFANLINWMRRLVAETTVEDRLAKVNSALQALDETARNRSKPRDSNNAFAQLQDSDKRGGLEAERQALNMGLLRKGEAALAQAETLRAEKARVAAVDARDHWREETKGVELVNRELEKYRKLTVAPLKGTANEISASEQAATEAAIRKRYAAKATGRDPGEGLLESITAQRQQVQLELQKAEAGGKVDEVQKFLAVSGERLAAINGRISRSTFQRIVADLAALDAANKKLKGDQLAGIVADDQVRQSEQLAKLTIDAANEIDRFVDSQDKQIGSIRAATAAIGQSAQARAQLAGQERLDQQYLEADRRLTLLQQKAIEEGNVDALIAIGKQKAELRGQVEIIRGELSTAIDERFAKENDGYTGLQVALQRYSDEAANQSQFVQRTVGSGFSKLEDAVIEFEHAGKLHLGSLFQFMADEFIRNWVRMQIAQQVSGGGGIGSNYAGGLIGAIGSIVGAFTSNYSANNGVGYSNAAGISGGRALGGDVAGGRAVMVGEHGPELAVFGPQGGRVLSNSALKSSGRSKSSGDEIHIHNYVGAQVSTQRDETGALHILLQQVEDRAAQRGALGGHAMTVNDLATGSGRASQALKSRGVSLIAGAPRRG